MPSFDTHVYEMLCDITISLELVLNLKDHVLFFSLYNRIHHSKKIWLFEKILVDRVLSYVVEARAYEQIMEFVPVVCFLTKSTFSIR